MEPYNRYISVGSVIEEIAKFALNEKRRQKEYKMKKRRQCVLMMSLVVLMSAGVSFAAKSAIDYVKDDMSKEWCYLGKSTTVIGVPFTPMPVQVTYDGAVFNGANEICFFYGKETSHKPNLPLL